MSNEVDRQIPALAGMTWVGLFRRHFFKRANHRKRGSQIRSYDHPNLTTHMFHSFGLLLVLCLGLVAAGCGGDTLTRQELVEAYEKALADTEVRARADWGAAPDDLAAAMDRVRGYYDTVTRASVEGRTREVYAEDAYLCDTLHIAHGAEAIEAYFLKTIERVTTMRVRIFDYSAAGKEVYTRWSMTLAADELAGGRPVTTYGMSHLRFDQEGKVVLHQDFWDASAGFFEHLPVLKHIIPRVRGRL